jgi:hypothetical protein
VSRQLTHGGHGRIRRIRGGAPALALALWAGAPAAPAAQVPSTAEPACRPVEGLDRLLAPGAIVLVGEMHGTAESPAFVADLVCGALAAGRSVTVALEIEREEGERVDAFLASAGTPADRGALLAGPFWRDEYQDGRRSEAMVRLLDDLRRARRAGRPLRATLLDQAERTTGRERDARMAARLVAAAEAAPDDFVVALTGNLHNRTVPGAPWDAGYEFMGVHVARALPGRKLVSLDVALAGGTAWYCTSAEPSSCGPQDLRARDAGDGRRVVLGERPDAHGFHGRYAVGPLTASPPAVSPAVP